MSVLDAQWRRTPARFSLADDTIHLWRVPCAEHRPEHRSVLTPAELRRAGQLAQPAVRSRFLTARIAARTILGRALGKDPGTLRLGTLCGRCGSTRHGKPRLLDGPAGIDFNISHSGDLVLVALARGVRVGVDIALRRPVTNPAGVAALAFGEDIAGSLDTMFEGDAVHRFFRLWTLGEARSKVDGRGLPVTDLLPDGWLYYRVEGLADDYEAAVVADAVRPVRRWSLDLVGAG